MQKAARVVQRTPEVLVRISGGASGSHHVREHLKYITRNGKLVAENEKGEHVNGRDAVCELARDWQQGDAGNRRKNSKDTLNLVLSMPPGTDPDRLRDAVRVFAARNFSADYQYVFARHDDTKHPHCHLTLKAVGYDGRRLNPRKADLQAWRESFASSLREHGIAAEATPRRARGIVRKGQKQAVLHARQAGRSTVAAAKAHQAARRVAGKDDTARPWEKAIGQSQSGVRNNWLKVATDLEVSKIPRAETLASKIRQFIQRMPPVQTEQQTLEAKMREHLKQRRLANRTAPETTRER